jgi:hypothetical protein
VDLAKPAPSGAEDTVQPQDSAAARDVAEPPGGQEADASGETGQAETVADETAPRRGSTRADVGISVLLLVISGWLTAGLWLHPASRALAVNPTDETLFEWFLAHATLLWTGDLHLVTHLLNAPDGVSVLANTSVLTLGLLLTPLTVAFGAPVSFAVALAGNLAATGICWYLLLRRTLRLRTAAAAVGGGFAAFAPGMISQSNGHPHIGAQWLVPPIVWCVHRLTVIATAELDRPARTRRVAGVAALLAGLVTAQCFLGEEVLYLTAITLALFCAGYAVAAPRRAARVLPTLAAGVGGAAVIGSVLLAYPLWVQFAGPQSATGSPFNIEYFSADLVSFGAYSPLSLAGNAVAEPAPGSLTELNTVLGYGLLMFVAAVAVWQRRRPIVVAAVSAAIVMGAIALGPRLVINGTRTEIPGPYVLLQSLPVIDEALPSRFALALIPLIAVVLAVALDAAHARSVTVRAAVMLGVIVALVPIAPRPFATIDRPAVPRFFTEGHWRSCVRPGGVLVPVPLPTPTNPEAMRWASATGDRFALPQGFFIGPYGDGGRASMGTYERPTAALLGKVARDGTPAGVTETDQYTARTDLAFWGAKCLVLADDQAGWDALRQTLDDLFGPGRRMDDVWVWRVD